MISSSGSHPQFMAKVLHILLEIKKNNRVMNYLRGCNAIASVHQINSKTYGVNSEPAKDFRSKGKSPREGLPLMRTATAAELKCTNGRN